MRVKPYPERNNSQIFSAISKKKDHHTVTEFLLVLFRWIWVTLCLLNVRRISWLYLFVPELLDNGQKNKFSFGAAYLGKNVFSLQCRQTIQFP